MKKREYMKDCFMNDDLFIAHLEQRAKDGWLLVSMNDFILTYKLTESQTLKFQIDYNEVTNEYKNILNDLGYTLTAIFDGKYVYYNKNINAEDLYNDEKTILMAKSHQFRISKIVHSFVWTFIFLTNFFIQKNDSLYMIYQFSLSQLLTNTTFYYIMTFFTFWNLLFIYHILSIDNA